MKTNLALAALAIVAPTFLAACSKSPAPADPNSAASEFTQAFHAEVAKNTDL